MTRMLVLSLIAALAGCSNAPEPRTWEAEAHLIDGCDVKIGEAMFAEAENGSGVVMRLRAWSLTPGLHGMHLHDSGMCESPEFQTAGGHFNPFGKKHGLKNPDGPHAGDLPNLNVPPGGKVDVTITIPGVTLRPGKHSLLNPKGTSLVIHADPDDERTDPAGNSGVRIACGVVRPAGGVLEAR